MESDWKNVDRLAAFLDSELDSPPTVVVVLGSGLGSALGPLEHCRTMSSSEIPGWPASTVDGHSGRIHRGRLCGVEILVQEGRVHLYEGYSPAEVVRPLRAAIAWGARIAILTNAAAGLDPAYKTGDLMAIEDHLNLTGLNPLVGPNEAGRGPRFPDMTAVYDARLRAVALDRAADLGIALRTGVYAGLLGPSYETPAEVRMLRGLGASAAGMSTVLEAIAARHMGARILGISCITNLGAGMSGSALSHDEVQRVAVSAAESLSRVVAAVVAAIPGLR